MKSILIICDSIYHHQPVRKFFIEITNRSYKDYSFHVIANHYENTNFARNDVDFVFLKRINHTIARLCFLIFGFEPSFYIYYNQLLQVFNTKFKSRKPELIFLFSGGAANHIIYGANKLASKYQIPLHLHLVDPIPPRIEWGEAKFRKRYLSFISNIFRNLSSFSANNVKLLQYQINITNSKVRNFSLHSIAINDNELELYSGKIDKIKRGEKIKFLYLGTFYGARKPDQLINSFLTFSEGVDCELLIVGNNDLVKLGLSNLKYNNKLKFLPAIENISKYVEASDVLVDVDANVVDDVFISGKIISYLKSSKYILSITPENSPTHSYFGKCSSICFAHYSEEINPFKKFIYSCTYNEDLYDKERKNVLKYFSSKNVLEEFETNILKYL